MAKKLHGIWSDFRKFITRGNVVDMAVGVTVATAFTAIVTAFTKGFIAPLVALLS
ncbi:MAG: MscL family protein, partial [Ruminococcus sp.]|nr:MscL family protein [Candidatus Apopatosoma intestinale]